MVFSLSFKIFLAAAGKEVNPDGALYIASAQQYAAGHFTEGLRLYRMPAFPLLIAGIHLVVPGWVASARIVTIGAMVLASIPLYKLTESLFDRRAAVWATLFLAVAPEANENALRVVRDPAFLCLVLFAVFFMVKGLQRNQTRWLVVGYATAYGALLFRVEGIVMVAAPVVFMLLLSVVAHNADLRSLARKGAAIGVGIPVAVALFVAVAFGAHFLTQNRIDELAGEVRALVQFSAFEKYRQIYDYFKQIQNDPPFSGFDHSLPATVRHWMPLIYMIGLLESLAKQLYPLFLLPLLLSLRKTKDQLSSKLPPEKWFVLFLFCVYLLFLYYFLVTRDKMVGRLLFTPAVLLYPWAGRGAAVGLEALKRFKFARALQAALVILFLALPVAKGVEAVIQSDDSALAVGQIIKRDPTLRDAPLLFSEATHCLYADRLDDFKAMRKIAKKIGGHIQAGRTAAIEAMALKHKADALVLFVNTEKGQTVPDFSRYTPYKRIPGEKGVTVIYRRQ